MRKIITTAVLAAIVSLPLVAGPTAADASCRGRANTGTVVGGVGGALVGNSISHGGAGAVIGGLGGAVLGHQIAKSGCGSSTRHAYYRRGSHRSGYAQAYGQRSGRTYYDEHGNLVRR